MISFAPNLGCFVKFRTDIKKVIQHKTGRTSCMPTTDGWASAAYPNSEHVGVTRSSDVTGTQTEEWVGGA